MREIFEDSLESNSHVFLLTTEGGYIRSYGQIQCCEISPVRKGIQVNTECGLIFLEVDWDCVITDMIDFVYQKNQDYGFTFSFCF